MPTQTVATGATVTLDGSGSIGPEEQPADLPVDPDGRASGDPVQRDGGQADVHRPGHSSHPDLPAGGEQRDRLSSAPSSVGITVPTPDVAMLATATASSQNTGTGQTAAKAIDGVVDGYPGDYTKEWATNGGGAGSWLKLTWSSPVTLATIVLYDRPNPNDQITAGNI